MRTLIGQLIGLHSSLLLMCLLAQVSLVQTKQSRVAHGFRETAWGRQFQEAVFVHDINSLASGAGTSGGVLVECAGHLLQCHGQHRYKWSQVQKFRGPQGGHSSLEKQHGEFLFRRRKLWGAFLKKKDVTLLPTLPHLPCWWSSGFPCGCCY